MVNEQTHIVFEDIVERTTCDDFAERTQVGLFVEEGCVALKYHRTSGTDFHSARALFHSNFFALFHLFFIVTVFFHFFYSGFAPPQRRITAPHQI